MKEQRVRLSALARTDIQAILRSSKALFGDDARIRYRSLLTAAIECVADDPSGPSSADRRDLEPGMRSLHLRRVRQRSHAAPVGNPVHILFYRPVAPGLIEIARVLRERMEPGRHVGDRALDDVT